YVNDFTKYGRSYRVVTQADIPYRMNIEDINKLYVNNVSGNPVPMGTLVKYELMTMPSIINHSNIFRSIEITVSSAPGFASGDALQALHRVAAQPLPVGSVDQFAGRSVLEMDAGSLTIQPFPLCSLCVF